MQINVGRNGQQLGTFNEDEVRQALQQGTLLATDLGWHEGLSDWQPLASLAVLGGPPVAPPPPGLSPQIMNPMSGAPKNSGLAVASMICGIAAIPFDFCCYLGIPLGIAAIICGHMAKAELRRNPGTMEGGGMATAGLICGYIALALMVLFIILVVVMGVGGSMMEELSKGEVNPIHG